MKNYKFLNNLLGWSMFALAAFVYLKTMEPTVSFWDCGEFIAAAFGMQAGHQPGAPLFMMLGKLFSLAASDPSNVAFCVNACSALASAATIMFLFWTITAFSYKMIVKPGQKLDNAQLVTLFGAGIVGSLAYTFSDSFWFSAAEAEVYALSSLSTAIVFWAVMKWEARADQPTADRWLIFIAYVTGLSIGLHLLNLLVIPTIALVYYFRRSGSITVKGTFITLLCGCGILGLIQFGVIQYLLWFAFRFDMLFVNSFHFGFGSGALFFAALLIAAISYALIYSIKAHKPALNLALLCCCFVLVGYSSYAMIIIRSNAKTAINISNPDNAFSLLEYVGREQYGSNPLLYGNYFDSEAAGITEEGTLYRKGDHRYEPAGTKMEYTYDRNTLFPRTYSQKDGHPQFYKRWMGLAEGEKATFSNNLGFFSSYQVGFMYFRYFLWNFSGKQNDIQGQGEREHGNWLTGINALDALSLGNREKLSAAMVSNPGYNRFYALPLILGIAGLAYQYRKNKKDAGILGVLFFSTGLAIILYMNQDPLQVRERDYVYVGSFYTFAIWIGLGVVAVRQLLTRITPGVAGAAVSFAICAAAVPFIMGKEGWDDHDRSNRRTARDMAANYLNSCAPNAILFTNADNDTYPLWYVQQVEGVRKDVRIICMQLLYDASYIDALKKQLFESAPLPVSMAKEKYARGTRDYLPFVDYGITDSVELKDLLDVMLSDNDADKVEMRDGSKENFLPSKKLKITIDPKELVATGTVNADRLNSVSGKMEWIYNKNFVTRGDLAVLDILANNHWKRPIYFTAGLGSDSYVGLERYLYLEGYAYRLLPLNRDATDKRDKSETANTPVLFKNMMEKFTYSFNEARYLDPESRRVANLTWNSMTTLATNLLAEGNPVDSKKVMDKAMKSLPLRNYEFTDTVSKYQAAITYYKLNDVEKGNQLISNVTSFLEGELYYYASLDEQDQRGSFNRLSEIVSLFEACRKTAADFKQPGIITKIDRIYNEAGKTLIYSIKG